MDHILWIVKSRASVDIMHCCEASWNMATDCRGVHRSWNQRTWELYLVLFLYISYMKVQICWCYCYFVYLNSAFIRICAPDLKVSEHFVKSSVLCRATYRDHFVRRPSVCSSICHSMSFCLVVVTLYYQSCSRQNICPWTLFLVCLLSVCLLISDGDFIFGESIFL